MPKPGQDVAIFESYGWGDAREIAQRLKGSLESAGYDVWIDREHLSVEVFRFRHLTLAMMLQRRRESLREIRRSGARRQLRGGRAQRVRCRAGGSHEQHYRRTRVLPAVDTLAWM